jgi:redox-sensitive bicupin YhaK (pirin superfamily)
MNIRKSHERGITELGWLHSKHSFSFGEYYDPENMGYRSLRVINDDIIEPGQGFGTHGHRDMEIISLALAGGLAHRDSLGHEETLRPGEVQVMSAGKGIQHSEFNPSATEKTHLLQIWIQPERSGLDSAYAQKTFATEDRTNRLLRVAGPRRAQEDTALRINQDADVYLARVEPGQSVRHGVKAGRGAWVHLIEGAADINGVSLNGGDAVSLEGGEELVLTGQTKPAEFVVFDLK